MAPAPLRYDGCLHYFKREAATPSHTRLRLDFTNGYHLAFIDVRMFGAIGLVDDVDDFVADERLGPDALELDAAGFRDALAGHRGSIKSTLMNQHVLAGLGNSTPTKCCSPRTSILAPAPKVFTTPRCATSTTRPTTCSSRRSTRGSMSIGFRARSCCAIAEQTRRALGVGGR